MVSGWDAKPRGPGFESRSGHLLDLFSVVPSSKPWPCLSSRFWHDVTEIQTKKLLILLSFYFQGVLQQLNTLIQSNFRFQMVLRLAIEDALISSLLRDAAFSWRPGELLRGL